MQGASLAGDTTGRMVIIAVALIGLSWSGRRRAAYWLGLTMAGGSLMNLGLKQIFAAPRPDLLPHLDIVHSYSFPSGHAAVNMVLFGALAMLVGKRWAYLLAAAVIATIGLSRVWLGVHWPSDVLAGWVEGLGWLAVCRYWLPAGGGEQEDAAQFVIRRHSIGRDESVDPETVEGANGRNQ